MWLYPLPRWLRSPACLRADFRKNFLKEIRYAAVLVVVGL
jgi:hypothetical protein